MCEALVVGAVWLLGPERGGRVSSQARWAEGGGAAGGDTSGRQESHPWGPDGHVQDFALRFKNHQKPVKM